MCAVPKKNIKAPMMVQWLSPKVNYVAYVLSLVFSKRDVKI